MSVDKLRYESPLTINNVGTAKAMPTFFIKHFLMQSNYNASFIY